MPPLELDELEDELDELEDELDEDVTEGRTEQFTELPKELFFSSGGSPHTKLSVMRVVGPWLQPPAVSDGLVYLKQPPSIASTGSVTTQISPTSAQCV